MDDDLGVPLWLGKPPYPDILTGYCMCLAPWIVCGPNMTQHDPTLIQVTHKMHRHLHGGTLFDVSPPTIWPGILKVSIYGSFWNFCFMYFFWVVFHCVSIFSYPKQSKQGHSVYQTPSNWFIKAFTEDLARRLFAWMKAKQLGAGQLIFMLGSCWRFRACQVAYISK